MLLLLAACASPPADDATCAQVGGTSSVLLVDEADPHAVIAPEDTTADYEDGAGLVAVDGGLLHLEGGETLRSEDGGCTWAPVGEAPGESLLFAAGATVYALGGAHHARSDDGGVTWSALDGTPTVMGEGVDVDPDDPLRVGLVGPDGVYRSVDGGASWARAASLPEAAPPRGGTVGGDVVVVLGDGLHTSTDGGATWTDRTAAALAAVEDPEGGFVDRVALDPADPTHLAATFVSDHARAVLTSSDGGATWAATAQHGEGYESGWVRFAPDAADLVLVGTGAEEATLLLVGPGDAQPVALPPLWSFGQVAGVGGRWVLTR